MNVPNSVTPGIAAAPVPRLSVHRHGLLPVRRGSALAVPSTVSRLNRPARSRGPLRFATRVAPCRARAGLPGGGILPGQDLPTSLMFRSSAHLLTPAGLCRRTLSPALARDPSPSPRRVGAPSRLRERGIEPSARSSSPLSLSPPLYAYHRATRERGRRASARGEVSFTTRDIAAWARRKSESSGRDPPCGGPPGQNPASRFPAPGSHLGSAVSESLLGPGMMNAR